ncbi:MAG: hypothetical protein ACR2RB_05280 [Gammaproteobacteria bacterium]
MPKSTRKKVITSAALEKAVSSSTENLEAAFMNGATAVDLRGKENKKLLAECRRLRKRRATLLKRKQSAAAKAKSTPNVETRKSLSAATKDLAATTKELAKARELKSSVSAELKGLKASFSRVAAYVKVIQKQDRTLNKPKRKRRRRVVKKQ